MEGVGVKNGQKLATSFMDSPIQQYVPYLTYTSVPTTLICKSDKQHTCINWLLGTQTLKGRIDKFKGDYKKFECRT